MAFWPLTSSFSVERDFNFFKNQVLVIKQKHENAHFGIQIMAENYNVTL